MEKMKGVSAVIATILMLMITIALAGMTYMYISTTSTTGTMTMELIDVYCVDGAATWVIRNAGTTDMSAAGITITDINSACTVDPVTAAIPAGSTTDFTATGCDPARLHIYRIRGPSSAMELSVYCN